MCTGVGPNYNIGLQFIDAKNWPFIRLRTWFLMQKRACLEIFSPKAYILSFLKIMVLPLKTTF
jgi:hypothetical protein